MAALPPSVRPPANPGLIQNAISGILGFQSDALQQRASATAARVSAAGYGSEIEAYQSGAENSRQNAIFTDVAGKIQALQAQRDYLRSSGETRAVLGASGFQATGSAIFQLQDAVRQSYLQDQLIRTQSLFDQSGYLEQARAAGAQADAAGMAQSGQLSAASAYDSTAQMADVYAANEAAALSAYMAQFAGSPESSLAAGVLAGTETGQSLVSATTEPAAALRRGSSRTAARIATRDAWLAV